MKNKINSFLVVTCLAGSLAFAQDKNNEKAKRDFDQYSYANAIEKYETLVEKGYTEEQIFKNLGDANYVNAKYKDAAGWYAKLFALESADIETDYIYRYAQALKSTKDYNASDLWMERFRAAKSADVRAIKAAENPDYLNDIDERSGRYIIKNLGINSTASDFAPAFNGEQLVFATARDSGKVTRRIHEWNNQPFLNLYSANPDETDFGTVTKLDKNANKKTHESSATFTKDGSTVYFTRNNSTNGNFARDSKGVSRLKIYRAKVSDGNWSNIVELPFNSDEYSSAHPALSPDESKLYFASDMPGSVGESDIFVVNLNSDGSIGAPVNMGNVINTEARETFPFVSSDNVLYFASDGHPGLGGLDVYATKIEDLGKLYIVNLGKPLNSEQDDFSYIVNKETNKGFFASNREGGQGSDDIYSFVENEPLELTCSTVVQGRVIDKETKEPIADAQISIFNTEDQLISSGVSAADGSFELSGDCQKGTYNVAAIKVDYEKNDADFVVENSSDTSDIILQLDKITKRAAVGTDLSKYLKLRPVYFDLDKSNIRPDAAATMNEVVAYLNTFPDMKVEVQSHTDVRASDRYNLRLSNRRARSTVAWLIEKGIDPSRITGKGFGETILTNDCTTRNSCTDERHEENRRSEFIVVE
jgi:outer membrane protein OmpA-like peptidoglycan-associated protein